MKKTILILAASLAAVGLLFQVGCNNHTFNITGTWYFTIIIYDEDFNETYTFVGNRHSGEVFWEGQSLGDYSVSGDQVHFTLEYYDADDDYTVETFHGYIDADDRMGGDVTVTIEGYEPATGDWEAVR